MKAIPKPTLHIYNRTQQSPQPPWLGALLILEDQSTDSGSSDTSTISKSGGCCKMKCQNISQKIIMSYEQDSIHHM